jgi:5-methylcytosine-specific restriction protein A
MNISKSQYIRALSKKGVLKEKSLPLLNALYYAPNCQLTPAELAELLGYKEFSPVNALIGKLGKRIASALKINRSNIYGWYEIVAPGELKKDSFTWKLNIQLGNALKEMALLEETNVAYYPELVVEDYKSYIEGEKKKVSINIYERNYIARKKCISYYGAKCSVCSLVFIEIYGGIGKGFIHVHHIKRMSSIGNKYKVDPIKDLRPVCPNCHAMLHQKTPPFSIEEMYNIVNKK